MYDNFSFLAPLLPVVEDKEKNKNTESTVLLNLSGALAGCYANEIRREESKQIC